MTGYAESRVDDFLDTLNIGDPFTRNDLVSHVLVDWGETISPREASDMLATYQGLQTRRSGPPQYAISCEGYGRVATWRLVDGAAQAGQILRYGINDADKRIARRVVEQAVPALASEPSMQPQFDAFTNMIEGQIAYMRSTAQTLP